jgi:hypothetical protein
MVQIWCRWQRSGLLTAAAVVAALGSHPAGAKDGYDLFHDCLSSEVFEQGACYGFVEGIADAVAWWSGIDDVKVGSLMWCQPAGAKLRQAVDVVVEYLRRHPTERHRTASLLVPEALREAWPCPAKR